MQMLRVLSWQIVSWTWLCLWLSTKILFCCFWPLFVLLWPSLYTFQKHKPCSAYSREWYSIINWCWDKLNTCVATDIKPDFIVFHKRNFIYFKKHLILKLLFNITKMLPVHMWVCVCFCMWVVVYVPSPPLEGKHSAVPLCEKCWVWGTVSDDKSKGQTASKGDILYSLSFTPPMLSLHPSPHLYLSSASLRSTNLAIIHCVWWVFPNYSIYSNLKAEYNKTVFPLLLLLCVVLFLIHLPY